MHFRFCAMSGNAQNRSFEKIRHQRIRFLGYMFTKNRHQSEIWHARCSGMVLHYNILYVFLKILKIFDSVESYIEISVFSFGCEKKIGGNTRSPF